MGLPAKMDRRDVFCDIVEARHRPHPLSGDQWMVRFGNGYGASIVRFVSPYGGASYGATSGLWELAVVTFDGDDVFKDFDLTYETPVTSDVEGYCDEDRIGELLYEIAALPERVMS